MEEDGSKDTLSAAAISALRQGNKIEAIKLVKIERGLGLKEAKDFVEEYLRTNPSAQASFSAAQGQSGRQGLWWLAVVVAAAILVYVLLAKR